MDSAKNASNLNDEKARLETFKQWPHAYISPKVLAKIGFSYVGPYDHVKCYFCNIQISSWELGDVEIEEHYRWSRNCPLINEFLTSNKPMESASELKALLAQIKKFKLDRQVGAYVETPFKFKQQGKYCFPFLSNRAYRLETFRNWPKSSKQTPQILSEAGFFYAQKMEKVLCFSCGGSLCDWDVMDDPWKQHLLHFGSCNYLKEIKESIYIEKQVKK